ncbi:MAG: homoserine kinase [Marinilabiliales bacterium]|nr:homoserine kinase [Marinilabiliales bacterium]
MGRTVRVKAPATVSNLNCGFDVLGFAVNEPYDIVEVELTSKRSIEIAGIVGCDTLSTDPEKNVVGAVLKAMIAASGSKAGFRVIIEKGIMPGSGIGSSAASSAAAALAGNLLMDNIFSVTDLVRVRHGKGEAGFRRPAYADNVAPALYGGITLVRSYEPLDIVQLNVPRELYCVIIHPEMEIKTSVSRGLLDTHLPLATAVRQWGNVGGLVAGLYREDYELISRSLEDFVAEPKRAGLIPGFDELKRSALRSGALGAGISGSGRRSLPFAGERPWPRQC